MAFHVYALAFADLATARTRVTLPAAGGSSADAPEPRRPPPTGPADTPADRRRQVPPEESC